MSRIEFIKNENNIEPIRIIIEHNKYKEFNIHTTIDTNKKNEEIILVNDYILNINSILDILKKMHFKQNGKIFTKRIDNFNIDLEFCNRYITIKLKNELHLILFYNSVHENYQNIILKIKMLIKRTNELKAIFDEIDSI